MSVMPSEQRQDHQQGMVFDVKGLVDRIIVPEPLIGGSHPARLGQRLRECAEPGMMMGCA
jgi:hypothetical protein